MNSGTISVNLAGTDDELRLLANWLRDEDDLRGRVDLVELPIEPGHMGAALAAIEVLVTSSTASTLVRSLFDWLRHRRTTEKVTLRVGDVEITCGSADDAATLLAKVREALDGPL